MASKHQNIKSQHYLNRKLQHMKNDNIQKLSTLLNNLQLHNQQLTRDLQEAQDTICDIGT